MAIYGKINMENINQNETTSQTQSAQILKALQNGERLTHLDAENVLTAYVLALVSTTLKNVVTTSSAK